MAHFYLKFLFTPLYGLYLPDVRTMISYAYTAANTIKGINTEFKYAFFDSNIRNKMVEEVKIEKEIKLALDCKMKCDS